MEQKRCSHEEADAFEASLIAQGYVLQAKEPAIAYASTLLEPYMLTIDNIISMALMDCTFMLAMGVNVFVLGSEYASILHTLKGSNVPGILHASETKVEKDVLLTAYTSQKDMVSYCLLQFDDTIKETLICKIELV